MYVYINFNGNGIFNVVVAIFAYIAISMVISNRGPFSQILQDSSPYGDASHLYHRGTLSILGDLFALPILGLLIIALVVIYSRLPIYIKNRIKYKVQDYWQTIRQIFGQRRIDQAFAQQQRQHQSQIQRNRWQNRLYETMSYKQKVDQIQKVIFNIPVIQCIPPQEYQEANIHDLKVMAERFGIKSKDILEKQDLIKIMKENIGSAQEVCSICQDDFQPGDYMRVLKCHHCYCIECIDRWFLKTPDYSKPPTCPVCNQGLT